MIKQMTSYKLKVFLYLFRSRSLWLPKMYLWR